MMLRDPTARRHLPSQIKVLDGMQSGEQRIEDGQPGDEPIDIEWDRPSRRQIGNYSGLLGVAGHHKRAISAEIARALAIVRDRLRTKGRRLSRGEVSRAAFSRLLRGRRRVCTACRPKALR